MGTIHTALPKIALSALLAIGTMPMSALAAPDNSASSRQPSATAQARAQTSLSEARANLVATQKAKDAADADAAAAAAATASAQSAYDAASAALEAAKAELAQYQEKAKLGALGFYQELGATTAVKYLSDPEHWFDEQYRAGGVGTDPNNLNDPKSATSLDNMKLALETMAKVNEIREADGLKALGISSAMMAAGQINLNYSITHKPFYHAPSNIGGGENIAAGYKDPFVGWYDKEKIEYDRDMEDGVLNDLDGSGNKVGNYGHYLNILTADYKFYGCAQVGSFTLQEFTGRSASDIKRLYGDDPYTAKEYYDLFMTYYNKVKGNVD